MDDGGVKFIIKVAQALLGEPAVKEHRDLMEEILPRLDVLL